MPDTPKIRLSGLVKSFGSKKVLQGLDLSIGAGESFVIIGGSGTGKSVTIKCILGLMQPDAGQIEVDGRALSTMSRAERREMMRKIGMLFQGGALFDSLKVWENVAFGLIEGQRMPRRQARDIAMHKLAAVGLAPEVGDLSPSELSGGMQKRVGLARAIATDPEIIFFDEPTTGLDPITADVINNLIIKCVKELGATAFTITHDMGSVHKIASKVGMLFEGRIIWQGKVGQINNSGNAHVDQFVHGRAEGPIKLPVLKL